RPVEDVIDRGDQEIFFELILYPAHVPSMADLQKRCWKLPLSLGGTHVGVNAKQHTAVVRGPRLETRSSPGRVSFVHLLSLVVQSALRSLRPFSAFSAF